MGQATDRWAELSAAMEQHDVEAFKDVYAAQAVFLEPQNAPHETNLLIQAYLNSWLSPREEVAITTDRTLESVDGRTLSVEWKISYTAGGRRWKDLPRASWFELDDDGRINYQRDYY